ncbi:hypothetical protein ACFQMA_07300 [Halosimplex aquaticum]|uniref:Uncharacterized protein n=1 Tax=Halosimplex aquaticum TaxID=3026162 RepID=A0ABD5Y5J2_9EURY|nr:hypothetical protein [Halosimplex aquaticum]
MSGWSPPSLHRMVLVGLVPAYAVVVAYALFVHGTLLLGLLPGLIVACAYFLWRLLVALEAIADGVHRLADRQERD